MMNVNLPPSTTQYVYAPYQQDFDDLNATPWSNSHAFKNRAQKILILHYISPKQR